MRHYESNREFKDIDFLLPNGSSLYFSRIIVLERKLLKDAVEDLIACQEGERQAVRPERWRVRFGLASRTERRNTRGHASGVAKL